MREPTEHTATELHDLEYYREEERREQGNVFDFVDDKDTLDMEWEEDRAQDEWDKEMAR